MKRPESAYPSAIGRNPLGAHFAAGLAVVLLWYFASVAQASMGPDFSELFGNSDFIEIIERDEGLETGRPGTSPRTPNRIMYSGSTWTRGRCRSGRAWSTTAS